MLLSKFDFISLMFIILFSSLAQASFNDTECLNSDFSTNVTHKGKPFGMTKNILDIQKENCVITIKHEKMNFIKNKYVVDVCRAPVHIKSGTGAVEVLKRSGDCLDRASGDFCKMVKDIEEILQDDGLIFAQGEKEDIKSDHGRVYCSFILLQSYLRNGQVLSRHSRNLILPGYAEPSKPEMKDESKKPFGDDESESLKTEPESEKSAPLDGADF